jgi:hypothetical protein
LEEFRRLSKANVKFSPNLLLALAKNILKSASDDAPYTEQSVCNGENIYDKVTSSWILSFQERFDIVLRHQTGKLAVSKDQQEHIEKPVAYHLGDVGRRFKAGEMDENMAENVDEIHYIVNMDDGMTLGFVGDDQIKYADVVSGGEGMPMIVRLTGGPCAFIQSPIMIFQRKNRSYEEFLIMFPVSAIGPVPRVGTI